MYDDANSSFARNVLFIPDQAGTTGSGTDSNCSNDPIGCWVAAYGVVDVNWTTSTFPDNIPWDYGFYVVDDDPSSHSPGLNTSSDTLDVATSQFTIDFSAPSVDDGIAGATSPDFTHGMGYSYSDDPNFMYCAEDMTTEGTDNIQRFVRDYHRNWFPPYAYGALGLISGYQIVDLEVAPSGRLLRLDVVEEEGHEALTESTLTTFRAFSSQSAAGLI